jgi:hypothetical protein
MPEICRFFGIVIKMFYKRNTHELDTHRRRGTA